MEELIEEVLNEFRTHLQADGGDIELAGVVDGIVRVRLVRTRVPATFSTFLRDYKTREGITCGTCRIPNNTIIAVLEAKLKEKVPSITKVELVK